MTSKSREESRKNRSRSSEAREALKQLQTAQEFFIPDSDRPYPWLADLELDDIIESRLGNSSKDTDPLKLDHYPTVGCQRNGTLLEPNTLVYFRMAATLT